MSDRNKAIGTLTKIRDLYIQRITEYVIENRDTLLDQAEGNIYGNSDELFALGEELRQVSVMLSFMPAEPEPPVTASWSKADDEPLSNTVEVQVNPEPISFQGWLDQVQHGLIEGAINSLTYLLAVDWATAASATHHFRDKLTQNPNFPNNITRLRDFLVRGQLNEAVRLLGDLFGLHVSQAVHVAAHLRRTV